MDTGANTVRCKTCLDSGEVTVDDGIAKPIIAAKEGKRPGWVGLLARTRFEPCADCPPKRPPIADKPPTPRKHPKKPWRK